MIEAQLSEFTKICNSLKYSIPKNNQSKSKKVDSFKLDFKNQLKRGMLLEDILVHKIINLNPHKSIYKIEGKLIKQKFKVTSPNHFLPRIKSDAKLNFARKLLAKSLFNTEQVTFAHDEVRFKANKRFNAKKRCLAKVSLDYCFIDVIIDKTLIDIKTDIDSKGFKKYLRQVLMQSIMYSSFLKTKIEFDSCFASWEIEMIKIPLDSIGIYFWRTNEFSLFQIKDLIPLNKYKKLVTLYTLLQPTFCTEMRRIFKKNVFTGS